MAEIKILKNQKSSKCNAEQRLFRQNLRNSTGNAIKVDKTAKKHGKSCFSIFFNFDCFRFRKYPFPVRTYFFEVVGNLMEDQKIISYMTVRRKLWPGQNLLYKKPQNAPMCIGGCATFSYFFPLQTLN